MIRYQQVRKAVDRSARMPNVKHWAHFPDVDKYTVRKEKYEFCYTREGDARAAIAINRKQLPDGSWPHNLYGAQTLASIREPTYDVLNKKEW